jgi:hypothetical protein
MRTVSYLSDEMMCRFCAQLNRPRRQGHNDDGNKMCSFISSRPHRSQRRTAFDLRVGCPARAYSPGVNEWGPDPIRSTTSFPSHARLLSILGGDRKQSKVYRRVVETVRGWTSTRARAPRISVHLWSVHPSHFLPLAPRNAAAIRHPLTTHAPLVHVMLSSHVRPACVRCGSGWYDQ